MSERFTVLVMAAGRGTRMRSALPKVLHPVCGKPMVEWVIDAAREAGASEVVCVTRPGTGVAEGLPDGVTVAEQREGEGTGAAVLAAREAAGDARHGGGAVGRPPAACRPSCIERAGRRRTPREGAAATMLTTEELDPAGLRPHRARPRTGRSSGSWRPSRPRACPRGAGHPRGQPRHLRLRGRRAARRAGRRSASRARRALPDRASSRCCAAAAAGVATARTDDVRARIGRQQPRRT